MTEKSISVTRLKSSRTIFGFDFWNEISPILVDRCSKPGKERPPLIFKREKVFSPCCSIIFGKTTGYNKMIRETIIPHKIPYSISQKHPTNVTKNGKRSIFLTFHIFLMTRYSTMVITEVIISAANEALGMYLKKRDKVPKANNTAAPVKIPVTTVAFG